jgi:16S rRNA A1518/A1519 N6-dimethyltransferase RsmA/KsgA/DIM1 with predicted DNA glycosylase/AP lyase activity
MVTLRPRPRQRIEVDDIAGFVALVQTAFQQRRKMLRRLLRESDDLAALQVFARAGVSPEARPEELSPADWRAWFRSVQAARPR